MRVTPIKIVIGAMLLTAIPVNNTFAQMAPSHSPALSSAPSGSAMAPATLSATGKVVARVNGVALTDRDLLREMFTLFPYAKQHNGFPKGMEQDIRHGAMKMIVFEELCYQEAQRRKMTVMPTRVAKAQAQIRAELKDPRNYQMFLAEEAGGSEAGLRKRVERMLLIQDLLNIEIIRKSSFSDAQLKAYYEKNIANFRQPQMVSFQTISVVPPPNSNPEVLAEARKRADDLLKQAKAATTYEKFGLLAEKSSDDDFRVNMGYRKPVPVTKLPESIAKTLTSMKAGQVSDLISIDGGYTILRLIKLDPPITRKFESVKAELKSYLQTQKQEELRIALNDKLRAKSKVEEL